MNIPAHSFDERSAASERTWSHLITTLLEGRASARGHRMGDERDHVRIGDGPQIAGFAVALRPRRKRLEVTGLAQGMLDNAVRIDVSGRPWTSSEPVVIGHTR